MAFICARAKQSRVDSGVTEDCGREELERVLRDFGIEVRGNACRCPNPDHEDRNPSASIHESNGKWRVHCHKCKRSWDHIDIESLKTGRAIGEILKEKRPPSEVSNKSSAPSRPIYQTVEALKKAIKHAAAYAYTDPDTGKVDLLVLRIEENGGKRFLQAHQGDTGFILTKPPGKQPIFNRTRVRDSDCVIVVEGEKCVLALHSLGIIATTSPGGAGAAKQADWSPLAGKHVFIWRDNDKPGREYEEEVADCLWKLNPRPTVNRLRIEQVPELSSAKSDVANFIESIPGTDEEKAAAVKRVLSDFSVQHGPSLELEQYIWDIANSPASPDWPWSRIQACTGGMRAGTISILVGGPGASKSLMSIQVLAHWTRKKIPFAALEFEGTKSFHGMRLLSQEARNSSLTSEDFLKQSPKAAIGILRKHLDIMDEILPHLHSMRIDDNPTVKRVLEWCEERAKEGVRALVIDPISAIDRGREPWIADRQFMLGVKKIAEDFGIAVLLVHHPSGGQKQIGPSLDGVAGGQALVRFGEVVLWLETVVENDAVVVADDQLRLARVNRRAHILKTRSGIGGGGKALLLYFDPESLLSSEAGWEEPKQR